ncbi:hypothetical protein Afe04nite_20910 [Asanoa ferruginea]|uniref:hypothetical protein n=1 Tax=Asanoa ferruginea TaxID=53367 RepID=UPI000E27FBF6|nr:hypothetical protein [Asanoa ferruginea]GIF47552.1 hypothetical protein Afe04nite_20910 [Asanoa ferruginea]
MRIVERWWNGSWQVARRDVVLGQLDDGRWGVWWWRRNDTATGVKRLNLDEETARRLIDDLIRWTPGPRSDWRLRDSPRRTIDYH